MTLRPFPLLADPANYIAEDWNLTLNDALRDHWIAIFRDHFPKLLAEAKHTGATDAQMSLATERFVAWLDQQQRDPVGRLTVMTCCVEREAVLRAVGIADPYLLVKQRENERALALLPSLLAELDAMPEMERRTAIVQGVFAGNIFDVGAVKTADLFADGATVDFRDVRSRLKPRPWLVDGLDPWLARTEPYHCAVLFIDNAGPDVVLGMIPFARDLLSRGTRVILAANQTPTLNDVTFDELRELIGGIARWDKPIGTAMADGRLEIASSGNGYPLIDLLKVAEDLCRLVVERKVDLVVLEGMGRAAETNFQARFTCDSLKLALIKEAVVASHFGGSLYDCVMRYDVVRSC